ncbi:MAG: 50S ribosomal protein L24 [Puniceicoccales bacterium]|jgi:large subunit ribosomal protein L24|nr:50S ribosomal protein L24 [Puniceicoccales bacterium]
MKAALKRGDVVVVIAGDDRGKVGKVINVLGEKSKVVVSGVAVVRRHMRKSQEHPDGAIIEKFAPIHVSNVMLKVNSDNRKAKRNKNA